jgi:hypothetical protein
MQWWKWVVWHSLKAWALKARRQTWRDIKTQDTKLRTEILLGTRYCEWGQQQQWLTSHVLLYQSDSQKFVRAGFWRKNKRLWQGLINESRRWKKETGKRRVLSRSCIQTMYCTIGDTMVKIAGVAEGKAINLKGHWDSAYEAKDYNFVGDQLLRMRAAAKLDITRARAISGTRASLSEVDFKGKRVWQRLINETHWWKTKEKNGVYYQEFQVAISVFQYLRMGMTTSLVVHYCSAMARMGGTCWKHEC